MYGLLKEHFGYDTFRPLQEEIVKTVVSRQDTFVLMPTGGGKSLCYQLPALMFDGITLVISPLIALQKDQVDSLKENGINAEFINSSIGYKEIDQIKNKIKNGEIKLLYIAPERLAVQSFQDFLQTIDISLIAIDEAHCISEWGHDFRPDYRNLKNLKTMFPGVPIVALTATATQKVKEDIVNQLSLKNPKTFISSFDRKNLSISVIRKKNAYQNLINLLKKHEGQSVIIYCFSRNETEEVAAKLERDGFSAKAYHAGLSNEKRSDIQEMFIKDNIDIIVATIAFGMGIDKPDVRLVVHYTFPKSLEGYYQEIGRAGRDNLPSECILFYSYGDKRKHDFFTDMMENGKEKSNSEEKIRKMIEYCDLQSCRRKFLLNYFGETVTWEKCGNCNNCLEKSEIFDATIISQKILSCIIRTGNKFGSTYIIDVLRGSQKEQILSNKHNELSVYGIVNDFSDEEIKHIIKSLIEISFIKQETGKYPTLSVSDKGMRFLKFKESISLVKPKEKEEEEDNRIKGGKVKGELAYDKELFEILRKIRKEISEQKGVPPFVIFGDVSLQEMAYYIPGDKNSFGKISGVGQIKLDNFGEIFLKAINDFAEKKGVKAKEITSTRKKEVSLRKNDISRYETTKNMILYKDSLEKMANVQGITVGTVINHIERLIQNAENLDIQYLKPEKFEQIKEAFEKTGSSLMGDIYRYLGEKISYEDIKIAKIIIETKHSENV